MSPRLVPGSGAARETGRRLLRSPAVFVDGPGGKQVPERVIDPMTGYYQAMIANSGGPFVTSRATDAVADATHAAVASLLDAAGDEIAVTTLDHETKVSPWRAIAADRGLLVRTVDIHPEDGTRDLELIDAALCSRTGLVAFGYPSNAPGTINPIGEIARRAHAAGARTCVDAVHYAPDGSIDVLALDTDFLVCSVYKSPGSWCGRARSGDVTGG